MKANEMPEKIYIFDYNDAMVTPMEGDTVYIREDAFIEKAAKWLSNIPIEDMEYKYDEFNTFEGWYKMIEDFRNYMKGE